MRTYLQSYIKSPNGKCQIHKPITLGLCIIGGTIFFNIATPWALWLSLMGASCITLFAWIVVTTFEYFLDRCFANR